MGWDDDKPTSPDAHQVDDNLRYRIRPDEKGHGPRIERPLHYTEAQCLLTEWLCLYRTVRLYLGIRQKTKAA